MNTAGNLFGPGVISTYTGKSFNVIDPKPEDVCIEDIAHALSLVNRFSGHTGLPYSVAQHSILVSSLCLPELALAGLLHDAHEAYIGDWSRPVKLAMPSEVRLWFERIATKLNYVIGRKFGLPNDWERKTPVRYADNLACAAEGRDLMKDWVNGRLPDPKDVPTIYPCQFAFDAEMKFIARYGELTA